MSLLIQKPQNSPTPGRLEAGAASRPYPQADKPAMIEAVKLLHPGRVVELRVLQVDGRKLTASGYFDQPGKLAEVALRYSRRAEGVYITLNPLPAALLGRANNSMREPAQHATTDGEVARRAWLPIDLDPTRPSGISSSEEEHQAALDQARQVREWLSTELGWHAPIFADSGNGAHLLYAIDLPNDAESAALIKRCLAALATRFDTEAVTLDQSVYNAARIWKLYGTLARKGESLPERPHRLAQIINAPDPIEPVTREQLEQLAASAGTNGGRGVRPGPSPIKIGAAGLRPGSPDGTSGDGVPEGHDGAAPGAEFIRRSGERVSEAALLAWLEQHGAVVRQTKPGPERTVYVLEQCPFAEHHDAGKAAVTLSDEGALGFNCLSAGCAASGWQELKALWGDGPARTSAGPSPNEFGAAGLRPARPDGTGGDGVPEGHAGAAPGADFNRRNDGPANDDLPRPWPEAPAEDAYYGLAGEIVRAIDPHTEADPVAVLVHLLVAFGCAVGRGPHTLVGATRHEPRLYAAIVGKTAGGRKGDSWGVVEALLRATPKPPPVLNALATGEGLIRQVCDEVSIQRPIKGVKGQSPAYERVVTVPGAEDKRLLIVTSEMGGLFTQMRRDNNIIPSTLRDAWDRGTLVVPTRNDPLRATGAYIAMIGHITGEELSKDLTGMHAANGFANRFCWFAIRRSKELPDPEPLTAERLAPLAERLSWAILSARQVGLMSYAPETREEWAEMYSDLSRERFGFIGGLLSRAPAQMKRLSMLYALLDGSAIIQVEHLMAAFALWEYAERSVEFLFSRQSATPLAEKIEAGLRQHGELTRWQIRDLAGAHVRAEEITHTLETLKQQGKVACEKRQTGGRPAEVWRLCLG